MNEKMLIYIALNFPASFLHTVCSIDSHTAEAEIRKRSI